MKNLKDYRFEFEIIFKEIIEYLYKNDMLEGLDVLRNEIEEQLIKNIPSIMFYGIYNAGKSTVINALIGEDVAKVGDVPTTSSIQKIRWRHYELIDTPGINANDIHTKIAEDEIIKNNVILFVIDDMGSFEKRLVYEAIVEIIKLKKPIIIVINQKQACDDGNIYSIEMKRIIDKVGMNIKIEAGRKGINNLKEFENFCGIIPINAQSCYLAKKIKGESGELLYKESGVDTLSICIEKEMEKTSGVKLIIPSIDITVQHLNKVKNLLKIDLKSDVEIIYLDIKSYINDMKNILYKNTIIRGKQEISKFGDVISLKIKNNLEVDNSSIEINESLNNIIRTEFEEILNVIQNKLKGYEIDFLNLEYTSKKNFSENIKFENTKLNAENDIVEYENKIKNNNFRNNKPFITDAIPFLPEVIIPTSFKTLYVVIRGIASLFMTKNNIDQELEKVEEFVESYNKKIEKNIDRRISEFYELNNNIRNQMYKLEELYNETLLKTIDDYFDNIYIKLDNIFSTQIREEKSLRKKIEEIDTYIANLNSMKY